MQQEERRGRRRFSVSWPICLMDEEHELARGETANLSRSGAYFRSAVPASLQAGMTVSVQIVIPTEDARRDAQTISGPARVVRLELGDEGCGIALHFSEEFDAIDESRRE